MKQNPIKELSTRFGLNTKIQATKTFLLFSSEMFIIQVQWLIITTQCSYKLQLCKPFSLHPFASNITSLRLFVQALGAGNAEINMGIHYWFTQHFELQR